MMVDDTGNEREIKSEKDFVKGEKIDKWEAIIEKDVK